MVRFVLSIVLLLLITPLALAQDAAPDRYEGDGFSLFVPPNATVEETDAGTQIVGPDLTIRSAETDSTVGGASYWLSVNTYENAQGLSSQDWAYEQILGEWQAARDRGEPTGTLPVTDAGELRESDVSSLTVGGLDAFRVNFFGGDSNIVNVYVAYGDTTLVLSYVQNITENDPLALVQQDIYALMLNSVEFTSVG